MGKNSVQKNRFMSVFPLNTVRKQVSQTYQSIFLLLDLHWQSTLSKTAALKPVEIASRQTLVINTQQVIGVELDTQSNLTYQQGIFFVSALGPPHCRMWDNKIRSIIGRALCNKHLISISKHSAKEPEARKQDNQFRQTPVKLRR